MIGADSRGHAQKGRQPEDNHILGRRSFIYFGVLRRRSAQVAFSQFSGVLLRKLLFFAERKKQGLTA